MFSNFSLCNEIKKQTQQILRCTWITKIIPCNILKVCGRIEPYFTAEIGNKSDESKNARTYQSWPTMGCDTDRPAPWCNYVLFCEYLLAEWFDIALLVGVLDCACCWNISLLKNIKVGWFQPKHC